MSLSVRVTGSSKYRIKSPARFGVQLSKPAQKREAEKIRLLPYFTAVLDNTKCPHKYRATYRIKRQIPKYQRTRSVDESLSTSNT